MHIVDILEQETYAKARELKCLPERESGRIAMGELFDSIAGTQSGAIGAALLSLKNEDGTSKYYAKDVSALFEEHGEALFSVTVMGGFAKFVWFVIGMAIFGAIGYGIGYYNLRDTKYEEYQRMIEEFIRCSDEIAAND